MAEAPAVVACIGAGRMGRGIAHAFAYAGHRVRLIDAKPRDSEAFSRIAQEAMQEIRGSLELLAGLGQFDARHVARMLERISIHPRDDAAAALTDVRFVFEGVPETDEAKREAFAFADAVLAENAIFASTTSTFLSTTLAGYTRRPERFLNAHWLNPAFLMPLVEVSPHETTAPAAVRDLNALLESIGKVPVVCKAAPGFIVSRIQALAMNEAARLVEEGVATAEDVDKAVKYGFGMRFAVLGLLEFIDWGGGDILYYASRSLAAATGQDRFRAPQVIEDNMAAGRIGMKSGEGFYDWRARDIDAYRKARLADFIHMLDQRGVSRPPVV